jgi:hypothetical protein
MVAPRLWNIIGAMYPGVSSQTLVPLVHVIDFVAADAQHTI